MAADRLLKATPIAIDREPDDGAACCDVRVPAGAIRG
jgi:hypothetical protein